MSTSLLHILKHAWPESGIPAETTNLQLHQLMLASARYA